MSPRSVTRKLIDDHLLGGRPLAGEEILLRPDQALTQDATGTLVMLMLEAIGLDRVRLERAVQYVDHNLIQEDHKNADDHVFLASVCRRVGMYYSPAGNGVSHPVHMQRFGRPGDMLVGSDSHTCAAGALGMLALGAGGADVALALAGEGVPVRMPEIWGVRLSGALADFVSAKDVVLEMLRRHGVRGGVGRVIEYHGPGLDGLAAMDRHVIANMGAELGATTTVFPSDAETRRFLAEEGRADEWRELVADTDATYDHHDEIDLGSLVPLIARPSSPGDVVPVTEVAGARIHQAYIGSSANPGYRDFAVAAEMVRGRRVAPWVSFDINPTSRSLLTELILDDRLAALVAAGARLHQAGCNGCIGMGQAPATDRISLRTVPRNFPGRSGTAEDKVYLCSPETAAASALTGEITDPRGFAARAPEIARSRAAGAAGFLVVAPEEGIDARSTPLEKGPNIGALPDLDALPDDLETTVALKVGDDVSTDEILPAGSRVLPYRSNIERLADFVYVDMAAGYRDKARSLGSHAVVAGSNYGQGSSREHAALVPRVLGLRVVLAKSFARIYWQNLVNFGVLPLTLEDPGAYTAIDVDSVLRIEDLHAQLDGDERLEASVDGRALACRHTLSARQLALVRAGGLVNWLKSRTGP